MEELTSEKRGGEKAHDFTSGGGEKWVSFTQERGGEKTHDFTSGGGVHHFTSGVGCMILPQGEGESA